jgi:hypothetical protein
MSKHKHRMKITGQTTKDWGTSTPLKLGENSDAREW